MPGTAPRRAASDPLATYRYKRDFTRTREPAGATVPVGSLPAGSRFVVQRHRARRLHYDFRLEMGGVLASWAVPKGPTLDPSVRRAAFHVEDHPLEYYDFEGVIPAGEYGGGDVIVWDAGTWDHYYQREGRDPVDAVGHGELHMELDGQKLKGKFVLVRTSVDDAGKESWLLLHKKDEFVVAGWDAEEHPRSVLSGRTNDEVKADPDRLWRSDLPAAEAAIALRPPTFEPVSRAELRALDRIGAADRWEVFGHDVRLTNLDKVLFPPRGREKPVTKRDLVRYAAQIAPTLVPYLTRRALNMHRFPNGVGTKGFWHKELPGHAPSWLARWDNPDADQGETLTYLVVDEPATLVWVANYGALEWHAWTSRVEDPNRPTYALVDLDPGERTTWPELLALARLHRTAFEHLGVEAWPKLTGRRGIQIWVPVETGPSFDETREWVERVSRTVGAVMPELVSWKWQVRDRSGLARLDYTQNAINKTLVAPYSPRAAPGAPVSAPIEWDELDDPGLRPDRYTIRTILRRLDERGDLFAPVLTTRQRLPTLH
ncbi:MAG: DNA polymerase ligase N-terminal domain-containing protein [Actinomycetales bacterium]